MARCRWTIPVASSRMITFAFLTSARANETKDRCTIKNEKNRQFKLSTRIIINSPALLKILLTCPTDKLPPSSSMTVSSVNRFTGVCAPLGVSSSLVISKLCLDCSTRYERFSASQSVTSSCKLNGSRFDRSVPETM